MAALIASAFVLSTATACEDKTPDDNDPPSSENAAGLDLSAAGCDTAGRQELLGFFEEHRIEVRSDDPDDDLDAEDVSMFCAIAVTWGSADNEEPSDMQYKLRVYATEAEAAEAIDNPGFISLTPVDSRQQNGLLQDAPAPWDEGFVWSTPDTTGYGTTEVAARIRNVLIIVNFPGYIYPAPGECTGEDCGVKPSELSAWLHKKYLPMVGENMLALIEK